MESSNKVLIYVLSIFIPIVGIICGIIFMNDQNPEKKKVGKTALWIGLGVILLSCICYFAFFILAAIMGAGDAGSTYSTY